MGMLRDLGRARSLPRGTWPNLARATIELAIARTRLRADHSDHLRTALAARRLPSGGLTDAEAELVEKVAFAIPRVARRVPWRADCMVQALAGERWLRRFGIAGHIVIGVKTDGSDPIDAHAWLEINGRTVTGGDVAAFKPLSD